MSDRLLEAFIQLVSFDQTVHSLEIERQSLLDALTQINDQKACVNKSLEETKKRIHEFKKTVDSRELIMKALDQQETDKKRHLESVSSAKEYSSFKAEIQRLNKEQEVAEQELIEAWGKLDDAQKKFEVSLKTVPAKFDTLDQEYVVLEKKLEAVDIALIDHAKQRAAFVEHVPVELLNDYEHMRGLVSNPVVAISQSSCSACFYPVPNSDLVLLRKGKMLPCKSCYRILYYDETVQ